MIQQLASLKQEQAHNNETFGTAMSAMKMQDRTYKTKFEQVNLHLQLHHDHDQIIFCLTPIS